MNDNERLYNALYEFILFELDRRENDVISAENTLRADRTNRNMYEVMSARVRYEYFNGWYRELLDYLKYFTQ